LESYRWDIELTEEVFIEENICLIDNQDFVYAAYVFALEHFSELLFKFLLVFGLGLHD
jgi:hypothetical protein